MLGMVSSVSLGKRGEIKKQHQRLKTEARSMVKQVSDFFGVDLPEKITTSTQRNVYASIRFKPRSEYFIHQEVA